VVVTLPMTFRLTDCLGVVVGAVVGVEGSRMAMRMGRQWECQCRWKWSVVCGSVGGSIDQTSVDVVVNEKRSCSRDILHR
jgi:hypothetical protein